MELPWLLIGQQVAAHADQEAVRVAEVRRSGREGGFEMFNTHAWMSAYTYALTSSSREELS